MSLLSLSTAWPRIISSYFLDESWVVNAVFASMLAQGWDVSGVGVQALSLVAVQITKLWQQSTGRLRKHMAKGVFQSLV